MIIFNVHGNISRRKCEPPPWATDWYTIPVSHSRAVQICVPKVEAFAQAAAIDAVALFWVALVLKPAQEFGTMASGVATSMGTPACRTSLCDAARTRLSTESCVIPWSCSRPSAIQSPSVEPNSEAKGWVRTGYSWLLCACEAMPQVRQCKQHCVAL